MEEACKKEGSQNILALLDQQHNKYKLVESQLTRSLQSMQNKIPEIEKTIQMIGVISTQKSTLALTKAPKLTLCLAKVCSSRGNQRKDWKKLHCGLEQTPLWS